MVPVGGRSRAADALVFFQKNRDLVNVNVGDYFDGETAAMKAAQKNSAGVLRLLLESGKCDITLKHKQTGKTALDYAKRKGAAECVALLEDYQKDTPRFGS